MEEYIVIIDGHIAIMDGYIVILETTNKDLSGVGMVGQNRVDGRG